MAGRMPPLLVTSEPATEPALRVCRSLTRIFQSSQPRGCAIRWRPQVAMRPLLSTFDCLNAEYVSCIAYGVHSLQVLDFAVTELCI